MIPALLAAALTLVQMEGHRRVLLVAAPAADDPRLRAQERALDGWREGAADRDVELVALIGRAVTGAADDAGGLRARFHLPPGGFAVILVGKDGREAYRSAEPATAATLQATIDAMPMRRAGRR